MSEPLFDSRTQRHDLPYLFAGQAQKEGFVNEAFARIDALLHMTIEGTASSPPVAAAEGDCWLIGSESTGTWSGHAGEIAALAGGNWLFFTPRDGMRVLNRSTGQEQRFAGDWSAPDRPAAPTGGTTVDVEARAALVAVIDCLTASGILPAS
ncbi:DUF2793 domain-containing protein [Novosphingobium sp.]|uniref:DUF2793 domain-containing protein n=1 Tax=Novosphingobium sp. TaxID=1874826 RepID=UPI0027330800|nr:DUF2793 domain-containing protein [Novosphingobium sp.]MDP3906350.1 DUF2793 domain-containing protein [Novosphingobium sp.]